MILRRTQIGVEHECHISPCYAEKASLWRPRLFEQRTSDASAGISVSESFERFSKVCSLYMGDVHKCISRLVECISSRPTAMLFPDVRMYVVVLFIWACFYV